MEGVLTMRQVVDRTTLKRSTIYKMMARDEFPAPIQLGRKRIGWRESDIVEWIRSRPAA